MAPLFSTASGQPQGLVPSAGQVGALLSEDLRAPAGPTTEVHSPRPARYEINIPTEMNKLSHPRKHFVGKIRPGDRMKERATSRLAVSEPTVCQRNPDDPGPGHYETEPASSGQPATESGRNKRRTVCGYTYDRYCREAFPRPPPGRYELRPPLPPVPPSRPSAGERIRIPLVACVGQLRREATLCLNSINIPVRPRKGRRSRKVAFLSGSARFRDREFFPIGGLSSRTTSTGKQRLGRPVTSKRSTVDGRRGERKDRDAEEDDDLGVRPGKASGGSAVGEVLAVRLAQRMLEEWEAGWQLSGGISRMRSPDTNKIPTRFFTVPSLAGK
uniref:Uncharacterized protein n=1 Tax=Anopheles atroparvus TaxID=41427 RepID=A0A182J3M6_ANOAO